MLSSRPRRSTAALILTTSSVVIIATLLARHQSSRSFQLNNSKNTMTVTQPKLAPVWIISHGGPPTMFNPEHAAHKTWKRIGQNIRDANLSGIVVVSAHWQASTREKDPKIVEVNVDETNPLVYDYYGFPDYFYDVKFFSRNPSSFSSLVIDTLAAQGLKPQAVKRGIDHGIFVPFKAAFANQLPPNHPHRSPTTATDSGLDGVLENIPFCQISLPPESLSGSDWRSGGRAHAKVAGRAAIDLGRALRALRAQNIGIIAGGQAVHNLRDLRKYMPSLLDSTNLGPIPKAPYAQPFADAISHAVLSGFGKEGDGEEQREARALALIDRPEFRDAHPTDEHFLPFLLAFGASTYDEPAKEEFVLAEGSMAWNMYRFG